MGHKHDHHECKCGHKHCDCGHHKEESGSGAGFALGVAIGAAAATLLAPEEGDKTRKKAKKKLDELTGGKAPEELIGDVKELVGKVVEDIKAAAGEGKVEAEKTKKEVLRGKYSKPGSKAKK